MTEPPAPDVLVIGGGPAGLSAATALRRLGVGRVMLIEREGEAGGVPRHCGHSPFGMREFGRVLGGRRYAQRLVETAVAAGVDLRLRHSAVRLDGGRQVTIAAPGGNFDITPRRIVLATGIREASRAARLLPGQRPVGILTTGALQDYVFLRGLTPFRRPLLLGSELVTMSALLTCASAGITPVALVEDEPRPRVAPPIGWFPRLRGLPVHYGATVEDIIGRDRVEAVVVRLASGERRRFDCDGLLLTGRFTPEASLARVAGIGIDRATSGPAVDGDGLTDRPGVYAAGNVLRAVRTAGQCWSEGRRVAHAMVRSLEADP